MGNEPGLFIAFAAGLLSFLSPCVLPLIPSYLGFIGGVSFAELRDGSIDRRRVFLRTVAFVLGFTIVFVVLGIVFASSAFLFSGLGRWINIVAGSIIVILGLNVMFDFIAMTNVEKRIHISDRPSSYAGAVVVGMAFGAGWSPCIGPILAGILFLAGTSGQLVQGAILLSVYSLGLGLPFLAASLAFSAISKRLNAMKQHFGTIKIVSGLLLVVVGALIAFGRFQLINGILARWGGQLSIWSAEHASSAALLFGVLYLVLAVTGPIVRLIRRRPPLKPVGSVLSAILIILAILEITGVTQSATLVARWLSYQGI